MLTDPAPDVREFLESYRAAFESYDAARIAHHFAYPCLVTSDAAQVTMLPVPSRDDWVASIGQLLQTYRRIPFASARILEAAAAELSPRLHQAVVHWELYDDGDGTLYDFQAAYTLVAVDGGLRIAALAHNELPRIRARLSRG